MAHHTISAWHAELSNGRMVTDIGPSCPDCASPHGEGMWIYLVPSEEEREEQPGKKLPVRAQCLCCHRLEHFDVHELSCENVQRVRAKHAQARELAHVENTTVRRDMGGIYAVVLGK